MGGIRRDFLARDIRDVLTRRGESLRGSARTCGIDKSTLSRALNEKPLTADNFARICVWGSLNANHYIAEEL